MIDERAHAVPDDDDSDEAWAIERQRAAPPDTGRAPSVWRALAEARAMLSEARAMRTRWLIALKHARRSNAPADGIAPHPAPAVPKRKGGHPGHRDRNDRLLALFEQTPERLARLQRCRLAARAYARELADAAGREIDERHIMPAPTVRDAVAEALRRRAQSTNR